MTEGKFFVYGSMSEGLVHFEKIREFVLDSKPALIQGKAYRLRVGFPVVLEQGSDAIPGQIVTLKANDLLFALLDQFHGVHSHDAAKSLYWRKTVYAKLAHGEIVAVQTYLLNPAKLPKTATVIEGGDWQQTLVSEPPLIEKLTERQRAYIQRLGASTGREIVPIDLSLYRELMNLEIIVDKGRRLALSKLGHEVYRHLN